MSNIHLIITTLGGKGGSYKNEPPNDKTMDNDDIISSLKKNASKDEPSKGQKKSGGIPYLLNESDVSLREHELDDDIHKNIRGKAQHWGYHLLVDCSDCNEAIDDEDKVEDFLRTLVKKIKMKPIGDPIIIKVNSEKEGRGVTGVQVIESSTITFHGDDDHWSAYIDVFSCAPYDTKVVLQYIQECFEPKKIGHFFLYRDAGQWPQKDK